MSLILPEQDIGIPCQFNHQNPPEFMVLNGNKIATFYCKECLTKQTLPNNAISISKAKYVMKQKKLSSFKIVSHLYENQIKQIEKLAKELNQLKTYLFQQIDQSIQTISMWRQQLELEQGNEKLFDYKTLLQLLHLNNEECELQELIRLEQKIFACNQTFHKKITLHLKDILNLDQFQSCQQILNQCIDVSELNKHLTKQKEFEFNLTKVYQNFPNTRILLGNFDQIEYNIQNHLQNWRNYYLNTEEIAYFYQDMSKNHNFLSLLFPNFFSSQFFIQNVRLNPLERNEIIKDDKMKKQLIENCQMYLCYQGVQLAENKIIIQDIKQFNKYRNDQKNKQGLQRVISSLSVLNQRKNALLIIAFTKENDFYYQDTFINYDLLQEEGNKDENALKFQDVKQYYLQQDLMEEQWATFKILTNQNLDL
ncbi:unnamed protein product [Paramecium pentaurelia]|uniref:Uncharacterized protein n=1 Tax=Paramecium pentaurelia TaxID=43138 RepID=A0A8S1YF84_9CILI|nr:unnamed protein product [Paramecium pentaurelia]